MTAGDPRASRGFASLLRQSGFAKLFAAGIASVAGFAIAEVCLIWIIFESTHSALDVAYYGLSATVAGIAFSVVGGTLVDRYNRKRLMIGSDIARALTMAILVVVLTVHGFDLVSVLVAIFVVSAFSTLFNPAERAVLPKLVEPDSLADANGLVRSAQSASVFAASSIGGLLIVTVGPVVGLAVNTVTLLVSAFLVSLLVLPSSGSLKRTDVEIKPRGSFLRETSEGFAWLWRSQGLFQLTVSATFFNFFSTIVLVFLVFYATTLVHGSALLFAGLLAANVAGGGIGSLLVGRVRAVRYAGKAWVIPYGIVSGGLVLVLALFPETPVALVTIFLIGLTGGFAGTAWLSAAQLIVPSEMLGRYFGIDSLGSWAIIPAGQILGGILIGLVGVGETYLLVGIGWSIAGAVFLLPRALRNLGYRPHLDRAD